MVSQRRRPTLSRRAYLTSVGSALGFSIAGCTGRASESVRILSAGSLASTFESYVGPAFESETSIAVHGEYYGTNALLRMIEDGTHHPDVVVSADATLLRDRLYGAVTDWDVVFAANSLGIAYADGTAFASRLAAGEPWYEVARDAEDGDLAISDPNLDPLGYRAVQAFDLAAREHDLEGLREDLLSIAYREPEEPQLLAGVESGDRLAAFVYRNMAVDHGLDFFEFPDAYNFANPGRADQYARASYALDDGYTAVGRPILYNATVLDGADSPAAGR
ncbi:MAG: extracellular solute-binding protein, partial [Halobacteriota archaeon]